METSRINGIHLCIKVAIVKKKSVSSFFLNMELRSILRDTVGNKIQNHPLQRSSYLNACKKYRI